MKSKEMAFCGVLCALALVFLTMGSLIPLSTYCCPMLAMVALLPVLEEYGSRPALTAYAAVAILSLLITPDKEIALLYLFLGYYPVLRPRLNRLPGRLLSLLAKLAVCAAAVFAAYGLAIWVFQMAALVEEFAAFSLWMTVALLVLGAVTFLLLDRALEVLTLLYRRRLRKIFFHK